MQQWRMGEVLFYLVSSFWAGAVHAATPGHGKTISAAYIVGARGRPVDAVVLGVFVTLSHTSGIVLVGVLASLGSAWLVPQRIEAYLGLGLGLMVIALGGWILWTQRHLLRAGLGIPTRAHGHHYHHSHEVLDEHEHAHAHAHGIEHSHPAGLHSHGWGTYHAHRIDLVSEHRPQLGVLLTLGIAGGLLPDPTALAILLAAISNGQVLLGLGTVLVFSFGFASALLLVGIVAAQVGQRVLTWLDSVWALRLQIATTLLILGMGVVLTAQAVRQLARLQGW
jgi:nickel/cobalt transporter (NicO) family protein